jgi:NitT/TauT family transport system ATP-binding protein
MTSADDLHSRSIPILQLTDVAKTYRTRDGRSTHAVRPFTLAVHPGEFLSIVGPSGCGKTTVLNMMTGLVRPSAGNISFKGIPLDGPSTEMSLVFQRPVLLPWRRIINNVLLPAEVMKRRPWQRYVEKAHELLAMVGLQSFSQAYPHELSGGMQQRASIARALVTDSQVLLMDEPFAALDAMTREEMNLELMRIWALTRRTIVFVTHNISEAVLLSDRIIVMSARPGMVREVITVGLDRPRTMSLLGDQRFGAIADRVRRLLESNAGVRGEATSPLLVTNTSETGI